MPTAAKSKIEVQNVIRPGKTYRVDAERYEAMKAAYLKVLPAKAPGLTPAEILARVPEHLPQDLFPGGAKAGWWLKGVQLDLEARGLIARENVKPLRLHRL